MIEVKKKDQEEFRIKVEEKGDSKEYVVTLEDGYYQDLTQGKITKEELIEKSFKFLLQRESKESILSKFNLKIIKSYFPEFEEEIRRAIFIPFHFIESPANALANPALDPKSKIAEVKVCAARVERIESSNAC